MNKIKGLVIGAGLAVASATAAIAQETSFFTAPTVSATEVGTIVTSVLAALALIWGARKAIKVINRS